MEDRKKEGYFDAPHDSTLLVAPILHGDPAMSTLLRLATAGSVDDGKSTLVGRLLHDSKSVLTDQLDAVERVSRDRGLASADLALLTDGLRAEREQGITIDVAYRYFATAQRSFVLADCPGHVQYTRNTVTGSSTADALVLLVDARKGVLEQTRRHLAVAALMRVPHVVIAVNKIDLVDHSEDVFRTVAADVRAIATELGIPHAHAVPVSALVGDNVVDRSPNTPWYEGPSLLELLETLPPDTDPVHESFRMPVQVVIRPQGAARSPEHVEYRGYAGQLASGSVRVGDEVVVLPSRLAHHRGRHRPRRALPRRSRSRRSRCRSGSPTTSTSAGATCIAAASDPVPLRQEVTALACWLGDDAAAPRGPAARQARVAHRARRRALDRRPARPRRAAPGADRPAGAQRHRPGHRALRVAAAGRVVLDLAPRRRLPPRRPRRRPHPRRRHGGCRGSRRAPAVTLPVGLDLTGRRALVVGGGPGRRRGRARARRRRRARARGLAVALRGARGARRVGRADLERTGLRRRGRPRRGLVRRRRLGRPRASTSRARRRARRPGLVRRRRRCPRRHGGPAGHRAGVTTPTAPSSLAAHSPGDRSLAADVARAVGRAARRWRAGPAPPGPRPGARLGRARRWRTGRRRPAHQPRPRAARVGRRRRRRPAGPARGRRAAAVHACGSSTSARRPAGTPWPRTRSTTCSSRRPSPGTPSCGSRAATPTCSGAVVRSGWRARRTASGSRSCRACTSAVAVPAAAGIPVTHRGVARGFTVVTGHDELPAVPPGTDHTVVLLMGVGRLARSAAARCWMPAARHPARSPSSSAASRPTSGSPSAPSPTSPRARRERRRREPRRRRRRRRRAAQPRLPALSARRRVAPATTWAENVVPATISTRRSRGDGSRWASADERAQHVLQDAAVAVVVGLTGGVDAHDARRSSTRMPSSAVTLTATVLGTPPSLQRLDPRRPRTSRCR